MILTLLGKAIRDVWWLLAWLLLLLFVFAWIFVWLSSKIELPAFMNFLLTLPNEWERLSGVPFRDVATPAGRVALAYVDPVVVFTLAVWAIARGSDVVAGEIGRGTMEMLLAQPVRRISIFLTQAAVTTAGSAALVLALWLGTCAGIRAVRLPGEVAPEWFLPAAANLFGMTFFLTAVASLASACDWVRGRVVGLAGGFYVLAMILKIFGRMAPEWGWIAHGSFLSLVEPQAFVARPDQAWQLLLHYNGILLGLGLLAYAMAAVIFCRRDLPAPL